MPKTRESGNPPSQLEQEMRPEPSQTAPPQQGPAPMEPTAGDYWDLRRRVAPAEYWGTHADRHGARLARPKELGALFVDFENIYLAFTDIVTKPLEATIHVLTALRDELQLEHGINIVLGRAYASWEYGAARDALSQLSLLGIVPQYVLSRRHKSSADLKLSIDLMEVLLTRSDIATYVIVGGDRDYMPIVEKIKERARNVLIVSPGPATSGDLIALVGDDCFLDATNMLPPDAEYVESAGRPRVLTVEDLADEPRAEPAAQRTAAEAAAQEGKEPSQPDRLQDARAAAAREGRPKAIPESVVVTQEDEVQADQVLRQYMHEFAIEDLWACVGLILRAQEEIRSSEIWIGPFLKNYMNEAFSFMNNAQRKRLLKIMEEVGAIEVKEKQDRMGEQTYSVLYINWNSPVIKAGLTRWK